MKETLEKATHDLVFACDDLREALNKANSVEGLLLLPLIGRANELKRDVDALLQAHSSENTPHDADKFKSRTWKNESENQNS